MTVEKKGSLPMLPNNRIKYLTICWRKNTAHYGMTLVELLVAMAILSIILTGLVTMFVSAIETTHQGYMVKENYGNARASMEMLARDLERACTLANRGEKIEFYGNPNALTFLTILEDGKVGRVTYFFAPSPSIPTFETWLPLSSADSDVVKRIGKEYDMKKEANRIPILSTSKDYANAHNLDEEKIILVNIPVGVSENLPGYCNQENIENTLNTLVGVENLFPDVVPFGEILNSENEYRVLVQPMALFRIEESGMTNIADMKMRYSPNNSAEFTEIKLPEPDINDVDDPFNENTSIEALLHAFLVEGVGTQTEVSMVSPVENQTPEINIVKDLRNYVDNPNYQTIKADFIRDLINIRKAELRLLLMQMYDPVRYCNEWYNLLKIPYNRQAMGNNGNVMGLSPYVWSYDLFISRRDQVYMFQLFGGEKRAASLSTPVLYNFWQAEGLNPIDYIIADGFGAHAYWIDEARGLTTSTDLLFPGCLFSYQSEENTTAMYFNDIRTIPVLSHYLTLPGNNPSATELDCLTAFLDRLWTEMKGTDPSKTSPFATVFFERLPVQISISAWICSEKPQPNVSDFRRWFSQSIDVPCGLRTPQPRSMPTGM